MSCRVTPVLLALMVASLARGPAFAAPRLMPASSGPVRGPTLTVVFVALDAKAKAQAGFFERAVETAAQNRFAWVSVGAAISPQAAIAAEARAEAVRAALRAGQEALDNLDNTKAGESFTAAEVAASETDHTRHFSLLLDALTRKAANHALGGEIAAAKQEIERLLSLNPKAELNSALFSPDLQKFADGRRKQFASAAAALVVRSEPPGANVWVDGQHRGQAPATVAALAPGRHSVVVALGGLASFQGELESSTEQLVALESGEVSGAYKKAVETIAKAPESPARDATLVSLGRALNVDQVVVLIAKKSTAGEKVELTALRIETSDGHNAAFAQQTLASGDASAAQALLRDLLERDAPRDGKKPRSNVSQAPRPDGKLVAGLVMLGVAAAAAGVGTGFAISASSQNTAFRNTPQIEVERSRQLSTNGRRAALVADISFLGAGVLALAGGGLSLAGALSGEGAPGSAPSGVSKEQPKRPKRADEPPPRVDDTKAADERRRAEEEKRKLDDERRAGDEAKARGQQAEETQRSDEEKRRQAAEEAKRAEEEKKRRAEEAKRLKKLSPSERRKEEARLKAEEEAKKPPEAADEFQRMAEERKRRENERKKLEEEERRRQEEDLRGK